MRFLRDFYIGLPRIDRGVLWGSIVLALAIGLLATALMPQRRPLPAPERFTAPPAWLVVAVAEP